MIMGFIDFRLVILELRFKIVLIYNNICLRYPNGYLCRVLVNEIK